MSILKKLIAIAVLAALAFAGYRLYTASKDTGFGENFAGSNGRLEATEIDVSSKLAGRINEILVDEGDFVTEGQLLAVMQTDVLEAQLGEANAQVIQAQAADAGAKAQIAVRLSDLNAAEANVRQRESELDQMRRRLDRSSVLSERGVITGQQFDDDETTEMAAQAAVASAEAQVDVARAGVAAAQADAQGTAAKIRAAEAAVRSIEADIKDSHLTAPRNGRVQYRVAQPGEVIAAGGKVINFVDLSDVYMNFFLPSDDAGRVAIGDEARIRLDAYPGIPIPAKITFVADTAQFTPKTVETRDERQKLMFRVKAKVDPSVLQEHLELVKVGLPGEAWVRLSRDAEWPEELRLRPVEQADPKTPQSTQSPQSPQSTQPAQPAQPAQPSPNAVPVNSNDDR